jgi:hypothetical protein
MIEMLFVLFRITMSAATYDHAVYTALPSLRDARNIFIAHGADNAINGELKDLLVKHELTDKFGLALLHSHAEIHPYERLTHFGNSAIPISVEETPPSTLCPCTWKVTNNGLLPIEFYFSASNTRSALTNETELAFVEELCKAIIRLKLEDLIGFSLLANENSGGHHSGVEISEGRCNITLPCAAFKDVEGDDFVDALWIFSPVGHKKCKKACKIRPGGHAKVHQTTKK